MGKNIGVEKYLYDTLESIAAIREFSADIKDAHELSKRHLERSAIERKFEIIGEALKNAENVDRKTKLPIRNIKKIKDTRNIIVHDYDGINYRIIWNVIELHLDELEADVKNILSGNHSG